MKGKALCEKMKNFGIKSDILLDQQVIAQVIITINTWKTNLILIMIYLYMIIENTRILVKKTLEHYNIIIVV